MQDEENSVLDRIKEQEMVIQEMLHQVKNDFNMLSSIMLLQSELAKTKPEIRDILQENMNRVKVVGLLYEQAFHQQADTVLLQPYITAIVHMLQSTYSQTSKSVLVSLRIDEISLHISKAQACGLIVHEAVSNSFRHAFLPEQEGKIGLYIIQQDSQLAIKASDNGKGLPAAFDIERSTSLGMQLIKSFATQLGADLQMSGKSGTAIKLTFPMEVQTKEKQ